VATKPASIQRLEIGSTRLTPESADPARAEHLRSVAANRRRRKSVGITIVALAAIGLLLYLFTYSPHSGPANTNIPTLRITRTDLLESAVATGTVKSMVGAEVKVGSQLSGIVAKLKVNIGDQVKKGDVLALLDDAQWRARVESLKAQLASSIAEAEYARSEFERNARLPPGLLPALDLEQRRRNVKVKEAAVAEVRARLAESETQLSYTRITAPVSGTIGSVSTYEGETVAASLSAPTFVTIVDLSRLEVQAYVDETDIGRVRRGQQVQFHVDSFPDHELQGVIRAIYPKAQLINNVVNYVVIVDIADRQGLLLRPEMTAHVTFTLDRRDHVLSIPRSALLSEAGRTFVMARQGDGWTRKTVRTGLRTAQKIEIAAGVTEGEVIAADVAQWRGESMEDKQ
jgi:HlyD family secretion protein